MSSISYSGTFGSLIDKRLLELTAAAQSIASLTLTASDRTTLVQTSRHAFTGQVTEQVGVSIVTCLELLWPQTEQQANAQVKSWLESADLSVLHLLRLKENGKEGAQGKEG